MTSVYFEIGLGCQNALVIVEAARGRHGYYEIVIGISWPGNVFIDS